MGEILWHISFGKNFKKLSAVPPMVTTGHETCLSLLSAGLVVTTS